MGSCSYCIIRSGFSKAGHQLNRQKETGQHLLEHGIAEQENGQVSAFPFILRSRYLASFLYEILSFLSQAAEQAHASTHFLRLEIFQGLIKASSFYHIPTQCQSQSQSTCYCCMVIMQLTGFQKLLVSSYLLLRSAGAGAAHCCSRRLIANKTQDSVHPFKCLESTGGRMQSTKARRPPWELQKPKWATITHDITTI